MVTAFFSLPRELRDEVYDYLWRENDAYYLKTKLRYDFVPAALLCSPASRGESGTHGLPGWLRTNKAILQEGLCHIQRISAVSLSFMRPNWRYPFPAYDAGFMTSLLVSHTTARKLKLFHNSDRGPSDDIRSTHQALDTLNGRHRYYDGHLLFTAKMMNDVAAAKNIKVLQATFNVVLSSNSGAIRDEHIIDLEGLGTAIEVVVPLLSRFELVVRCVANVHALPESTHQTVESSLLLQSQRLSRTTMKGMTSSAEKDGRIECKTIDHSRCWQIVWARTVA